MNWHNMRKELPADFVCTANCRKQAASWQNCKSAAHAAPGLSMLGMVKLSERRLLPAPVGGQT